MPPIKSYKQGHNMKIMRRDNSGDDIIQKRRYERRSSDTCVGEINGRNYPIINWSNGGALIFADDRLFNQGEKITFKMKFRVRDRIISIPHAGEIIRKGALRIAIQFDEMNDAMRKALNHVIDDTAVREFADSQI
tara:strand:- start:1200 stop:1604 length:405 start_codon:yes stop_codon:yes gene_type:complete